MTSLEKATKLVNRWTSEALFLYADEQGVLLIERIAEAIDKAEQDAYERGLCDGKEEEEL